MIVCDDSFRFASMFLYVPFDKFAFLAPKLWDVVLVSDSFMHCMLINRAIEIKFWVINTEYLFFNFSYDHEIP